MTAFLLIIIINSTFNNKIYNYIKFDNLRFCLPISKGSSMSSMISSASGVVTNINASLNRFRTCL